MIATDDSGHIMFINMKGEKGNYEKKVANSSIVNFEVVKNTPFLLMATPDEFIFYKINKGFQVQKLTGGHMGPVTGLFYLDFKRIHQSNMKASSRLISIGDDNTIRVWDSVDQTQLACFSCPQETEIMCMEYLPKFGLLVTGHENGDLYMWDIEIGNNIKMKSKTKSTDIICCLTHFSDRSTGLDMLCASG